jgi:hypothetical protein
MSDLPKDLFIINLQPHNQQRAVLALYFMHPATGITIDDCTSIFNYPPIY